MRYLHPKTKDEKDKLSSEYIFEDYTGCLWELSDYEFKSGRIDKVPNKFVIFMHKVKMHVDILAFFALAIAFCYAVIFTCLFLNSQIARDSYVICVCASLACTLPSLFILAYEGEDLQNPLYQKENLNELEILLNNKTNEENNE